MMPALPERTPAEEYLMAAEAIGCRPSLVRAIAHKETWNHQENPADIRREDAYWRRYRMASRAAKAFDGKPNPPARETRWKIFAEMDAACASDAVLNPRARDAAILCHSFGWCQIMGFNHAFCDYESPRDWLAAMATMEGQRECFIALVRSNDELHAAFRAGNHAVIAYHYNGPQYARNRYDRDIAKFDLAFRSEGGAFA